MNLSNNQLTLLPESIGDLDNLETIILHHNQITSLPESFGNLSSLFSLNLGYNTLSSFNVDGEYNFPHLNTLDLQWNNISTFPIVSTFPNLVTINLSGNTLSGTFPTELQGLDNLSYLFLYRNLYEGEIPSWLFGLPNLSVLKLQHNNFSGEIPPEICDLNTTWSLINSYMESGIYDNGLCPPYPECIEDYIGEQDTSDCPDDGGDDDDDDDDDDEDGPPCTDVEVELWGQCYNINTSMLGLTQLILDNNQLTGEIPSEIGNLTNLSYLFLNDNHLTGIPTEIDNLNLLVQPQQLKLEENCLSNNLTWEDKYPVSLGKCRLNLYDCYDTYGWDNPGDWGSTCNYFANNHDCDAIVDPHQCTQTSIGDSGEEWSHCKWIWHNVCGMIVLIYLVIRV